MLGPESLLMLHHVNQVELIAGLRGRVRAAERGHPGTLRRWSHRPACEAACEAACVA